LLTLTQHDAVLIEDGCTPSAAAWATRLMLQSSNSTFNGSLFVVAIIARFNQKFEMRFLRQLTAILRMKLESWNHNALKGMR